MEPMRGGHGILTPKPRLIRLLNHRERAREPKREAGWPQSLKTKWRIWASCGWSHAQCGLSPRTVGSLGPHLTPVPLPAFREHRWAPGA